MFSSLLTLPTCWEQLQKTEKPIVMYGMGNGADRILAILERLGVTVSDFFASDAFVRGQLFHGKRVKTFTEIQSQHEDFVIVVAFASEECPVMDQIGELNRQYELYVPDMPVVGDVLFDRAFLSAHMEEVETVYHMLADEKSREVYRDLIAYKLTGRLDDLMKTESDRAEVLQELLPLGSEEGYVDLGAYNGDTVAEFLAMTGGAFSSIHAMEPDPKNFLKLQKRLETMGIYPDPRVQLHNAAAWEDKAMLHFAAKSGRNSTVTADGRETPADSVDRLTKDFIITYLKMDVEGSEREAIHGAVKTIRRCRPKLMLSAYHLSRDLFFLPLLIQKITPGYRFYLRRFPYIPAWEINYICLPEN